MRIKKIAISAVCAIALTSALMGSEASADTTGDTRTVTTLTETESLGGKEKEGHEPRKARISETVKERKNRLPKEDKDAYRARLKLLTEDRQAESDGMSTQLKSAATTPTRWDPTILDCQTQVKDQAERPEGFVIDHFNWCKVGYYNLKKELCDSSYTTCKTVAEANLRATTLGNGNQGIRETSFIWMIDQVQIVMGDAATMQLSTSMNCIAYGSAVCNGNALNGRTDTLASWMNDPYTYFDFASPEPGTTAGGVDQISFYDFTGSLQLVGGNALQHGENGFRCDSATYIVTAAVGCVFDLTTELFYDLSVNDTTVDESAKHIDDAQYRPSLTFPSWTGKTTPGAITSGEPLSRLYHDRALRDANHAKAVSTCKAYYGDDYATYGQDCDEYPFQSTMQGAASGDDRYSARALTSEDNQAAGRMLGDWYSSQRILDSDPFYVYIQGGSGFPIT